jgi:predicted secreted protein
MSASIELENRQQPEIAATFKPATATEASTEGSPNIEEGEVTIQQLKPADRGPDAWKLLITAFVFEALLWGMYFDLCSRRVYQILMVPTLQAFQFRLVSSRTTTPRFLNLQGIPESH